MDFTEEDLRAEEEAIERELAEMFPKKGDRLFVPSPSGARLDPLGFTGPGEKRSPIGRWQLYSGGFLHAADRLVDGTIGAPHEDELVYPILGLYRHHLELELKYVIRYQSQDPALRKWLREKHRLTTLWDKLAQTYPRFGAWASDECTRACSELLAEFDRHDPNSQGVRYPEDHSGAHTLTRLAVIDLANLKRSVHKISHYLGAIVEQTAEDREWEDEMESW
jgi:hypothetical protein